MKDPKVKAEKTPIKFYPISLILLNADYIDDNGKPAKQRWHLIIEANEKWIKLLKITSRWKNYFFQSKLGFLECLKKLSFVIHNRILVLKSPNLIDFSKFRICRIHQKGCLEKENFARIIQRLNKFWTSEFSRDKKIIELNLSDLKNIKEHKLQKNRNYER